MLWQMSRVEKWVFGKWSRLEVYKSRTSAATRPYPVRFLMLPMWRNSGDSSFFHHRLKFNDCVVARFSNDFPHLNGEIDRIDEAINRERRQQHPREDGTRTWVGERVASDRSFYGAKHLLVVYTLHPFLIFPYSPHVSRENRLFPFRGS